MLERHVLLDSSVLINILASGRERELLRIFPKGAGVSAAVEAESLFLRGANPNDPWTQVVLAPLIDSGLLQRHDCLGEGEQALYVELAADLHDGEAMTIAVGHERGFAVATDDRKARRIATQRFGDSLPLLRTSEIIFEWARKTRPAESALHELLRRIQIIAQFRPANDDPLRDWWSNSTGSPPRR